MTHSPKLDPELATSSISHIALPIAISMQNLQEAVNAQTPKELAQIDHEEQLLNGLLTVHLKGCVQRTDTVQLSSLDCQTGLLVCLPITAQFRATPKGVGAFLARDFGGSATIELRLFPALSSNWEFSIRAHTSHQWTDPLSVQLWQGLQVSVRSLVDEQIKSQLQQISTYIEKTVQESGNIKQRAQEFWRHLQQPWTLPSPIPSYALIQPEHLTITPFICNDQHLHFTLSTSVLLSAHLGEPPQKNQIAAHSELSLPSLNILTSPEPVHADVSLCLPLHLPYKDLSRIASNYTSQHDIYLPVPTRPMLCVRNIVFSVANQIDSADSQDKYLKCTLTLDIIGPFDLQLTVLTDICGMPIIDRHTNTLKLQNVHVHTHPNGLSGKLIAWLADARVQQRLCDITQIDLHEYLETARRQLQDKLPFSPLFGIQLDGNIQELSLKAFELQTDGIIIHTYLQGALNVSVSPNDIEHFAHGFSDNFDNSSDSTLDD